MNNALLYLGSFVVSVFIIFIARAIFRLKLNDKGVVVIAVFMMPILAILYIFLQIFWR